MSGGLRNPRLVLSLSKDERYSQGTPEPEASAMEPWRAGAPRQDGPALTVAAYAKVNLTLEVLGPRDDGLHEVATMVQTIDLADRLSFRLA